MPALVASCGIEQPTAAVSMGFVGTRFAKGACSPPQTTARIGRPFASRHACRARTDHPPRGSLTHAHLAPLRVAEPTDRRLCTPLQRTGRRGSVAPSRRCGDMGGRYRSGVVIGPRATGSAARAPRSAGTAARNVRAVRGLRAVPTRLRGPRRRRLGRRPTSRTT